MTASDQESSAAAHPVEREVIITRVFDAPRDLVFQAWTDPKYVANWWGPAGFTNPVCKMNVRPGGVWLIVMRAPDGVEYPCGGVYREVVAPERLVFTNTAEDRDGKLLIEGVTTVTFAEHGGKTKLTLQTRATAVVAAAARMLEGMQAGWTQSMERLAKHLSEKSDRELVFTRVFDAPRELVFKAWIDPNHIVHWWGPRGFTTTNLGMDVRPAGSGASSCTVRMASTIRTGSFT